ncbi:MAG: PAS domain-containing protein [Acidimicrobiia bacterium]
MLSSHSEIASKARGTPIEVRIRVADRTYRLMEVIGGTRETVRGVVVVMTLRDVTERRQWEVTANRPEAFRVLVETMPVIVALIDGDRCVQSVSGAFNRQLGHDPSRVLGVDLFEFVVEADTDRVRERLREAAETPGTSVIETELRCADGRGVPFELTVTNLLDDPVVEGLVVCGIDVTERAHAVDALDMSARRFEAVLDSSTDLVTVIDAAGKITYVNSVNERLLGRTPTEGLGSSVFDKLHPDDVGRAAEVFATAKGTPGPEPPFEVRVQHGDGTYRNFEVSANNLLHDPALSGIVITSRDVTERRSIEASLQDAKLALRVSSSLRRLASRSPTSTAEFCGSTPRTSACWVTPRPRY